MCACKIPFCQNETDKECKFAYVDELNSSSNSIKTTYICYKQLHKKLPGFFSSKEDVKNHIQLIQAQVIMVKTITTS